jgi:TPR repeat protein
MRIHLLMAGSIILMTGLHAYGQSGAPSTAQAPGSNASRPARPASAEQIAALTGKANGGDQEAQLRLGQIIEEGARTLDPKAAQQRYAEAAKWYKLAADQGNPIAENNFGAMLVDGRGVNEDASEAASYYRRAAQAGNREAQTNLAILIMRKRVPGTQEEALHMLSGASDAGFAPAQAQLAQIYLDGLLLAPDDVKAAALFQASARQDYSWGEYGYALMLQSGTGVPRDLPAAESWMERAAASGLPVALYDLSRMLDIGLGVPADRKRAQSLLEEAARRGEPRAKERLHPAAKSDHPAP